MESSDEADYIINPAFWLNGQALGFPVQFDLVLKHLRQDMRDETKARVWLGRARKNLRYGDLTDTWDQVARMGRVMNALCPADEPPDGGTQTSVSSPYDVVLDPRKFDDDILVESEYWTDDALFENAYDFGLAFEPDNPKYLRWCAWLAKNHPRSGGSSE